MLAVKRLETAKLRNSAMKRRDIPYYMELAR